MWTCSQRNLRSRLRSIAPGSSPASSRIWKPLQMPSTGPPRGGEALDRPHDRREARHRAGAQVVAVREAARQDHDVGAFKVGVLVPDVFGALAEHVGGRMKRVLVAVRSRKHHDREFHARPPIRHRTLVQR